MHRVLFAFHRRDGQFVPWQKKKESVRLPRKHLALIEPGLFFLKIISMFHRVLPDFNGSHKTQLFSLSFFFFFFLPSVWVIDHVMLVERAHLGEYLLGFYRVLPSFTEFLPAAVRLCHRIVPGPTRRVGFVCLFVCLFFIIVPSFLPSFHVRPSNWP